MSAAIESRVIRRHCTERGCGEARAMVAGFAAATPVLSPLWQQLDRALADVPARPRCKRS
jgi:hypothetical protein